MERHSNIFRLYYRDGAESNPYEPTESDVFLARGEESGGVTDDYDAGCFTEDLPEDGTKFLSGQKISTAPTNGAKRCRSPFWTTAASSKATAAPAPAP